MHNLSKLVSVILTMQEYKVLMIFISVITLIDPKLKHGSS